MSRMSMPKRTSIGEIRVLPDMFKARALQMAEEMLNEMLPIWAQAGYEESEKQRLLGDILSKVKDVYSNEVVAEKQILEHAKQQIQAYIQDYTSFNKQLGRESNLRNLDGKTCTEQLAELEDRLAEIGAEVSARQRLLDVEMAAINDVVQELGENPPDENQFSGPNGTPPLSDVRLNLMRQYHRELEILKSNRIEEMKDLAKEAYLHMADLMYAEEMYDTMSDSKKYITLDKLIARYGKTSEFSFGVHKNDLAQLTLRLKLFIEEKERRRVELAKIGEEIARLWTLLRVPAAERELFQNSFKRNLSTDTLKRGAAELAKLQEARKSSLIQIVSRFRSDILTLWEEAGIESDESRSKEFPHYYDDINNLEDSAVEVHEQYFKELRDRVEEMKPILLKISRREGIISDRIELEHLQMNPERLTARGPNAREERKREEAMTNRVKNLEKFTKEIVAQIYAWEEIHGPFIYAGERYFDRIAKQEEIYIETRDTLRNSRKKKDSKPECSLVATKPLPGKKATFGVLPSSTLKGKTLTGTLTLPAPPSIVASQTLPPQTSSEETENLYPTRNLSRDSEGTTCTSVTHIKDRSSTGSITIVHESTDANTF